MLCIGLDVAWFGGRGREPDSQYDFLAALHLPRTRLPNPTLFRRVHLQNRDTEAQQLLAAIRALSNGNDRIVLAIDAPLKARARPKLPVRISNPRAGTIERRECERYMSIRRQEIDNAAGGCDGWHPNIQPGAPLPPRVTSLLNGLTGQGFVLWSEQNRQAQKLIIECFPAEAIWAANRLGHYPDAMTATCAKAYKKQSGNRLTAVQVRRLVHDVLDAFAEPSGESCDWTNAVNEAIRWMLDDNTWRNEDVYRGGKLLDDVVDSMICLATALSYANGCSHVWQHPDHLEDGHIVGPGIITI